MQKDAEHVLAPVASCYFMGGFILGVRVSSSSQF